MGVTIDELLVADRPEAWAALGFEVGGDVCTVGEVRLRFVDSSERGLTGWSLRGAASTDLDGLPTTRADAPPAEPSPHQQPPCTLSPSGRQKATGTHPDAAGTHPDAAGTHPDAAGTHPNATSTHPNGVVGLDHVVAITPDLERTVAALEAAGLDLRRVREEPTPAGAPRQAFFRLGAVILELVQEPAEVAASKGADRPAFFWGLAFSAPDIEAAAARLGDRASEVREAVQPGRRIVTLRRTAGLSLPVALITPPPDRDRT